MGVQRALQQQTPLLKIRQDQRVSLLNEGALPRRARDKMALGVHQLHKGQASRPPDAGVILTKGGGNVHDAGAIRQRHIIIRHHIPGLFRWCHQSPQRLIFHAQQGLALHEGFVGHLLALFLRKQGGNKRGGHDHGVAVQGEATVFLLGVHAQRHV